MRWASLGILLGGCSSAPCPPLDPPTSLGRFVDVSPDYSCQPPPATNAFPQSTGIFGDLDGDGVPELIVSQVSVPGSPLLCDGRTRAYRYLNGRFVDTGVVTDDPSVAPAAALDLDEDGVVDLLNLSCGHELSWGLGGGRFAPSVALDPTGKDDPIPCTVSAFGLYDLDGDGHLDVVESVDSAEPLLYLRSGPRKYVRAHLLAGAQGQGQASIAIFHDGDGTVFGHLGAPDQPDAPFEFYRAGTASRFTPLHLIDGPCATPTPMGATIGDLDGDGRLDLYLSLNPAHYVLRGLGGGGFEPRCDCFPALVGDDRTGRFPGDARRPLIPWGAAMLDIDADGRLDLIIAHGNDGTAWEDPRSNPGDQWNAAYWNGGDFHFADVASAVGLSQEHGHWRSIAVGDFDGDGDADLIFGTEGGLPRVYRNDVRGSHHSIALRLHGTRSNPLGIGARVAVTLSNGKVITQVAGSVFSLWAFSEPLVFVGLGADAVAPGIVVTWPSGARKELKDVAADRIVDVSEP
jgi:hypothetical protein